MAKKQQQCIQNIFDQQPDGVIILAQPIKQEASKKEKKPGSATNDSQVAHVNVQDDESDFYDLYEPS